MSSSNIKTQKQCISDRETSRAMIIYRPLRSCEDDDNIVSRITRSVAAELLNQTTLDVITHMAKTPYLEVYNDDCVAVVTFFDSMAMVSCSFQEGMQASVNENTNDDFSPTSESFTRGSFEYSFEYANPEMFEKLLTCIKELQ